MPAVSATTLVVNSTADGGDISLGDGVCDDGTPPPFERLTNCTLRAAIEESNALPGPDEIQFDIPGDGVHTISPSSQLPDITDSVTIDGYTQPGAYGGWLPDQLILIEVDGAKAGPEADGLVVDTFNSTVTGLAITRFGQSTPLRGTAAAAVAGAAAIVLKGGSNVVSGNHIGVDASGVHALGNRADGVRAVQSFHSEITDNVISANGGNGIALIDSGGVDVFRNYIGTDASGSADLGNGLSGILIEASFERSAESNAIGRTSGDGNVVSGNGGMGIEIRGSGAFANEVLSNQIGTDVTGTQPLGNALAGVYVAEAQLNTSYPTTLIGGGCWGGGRNTISANGGPGIHIVRSNDNAVVGNNIGTDVSGTLALGNIGGGVLVEAASSNLIGEGCQGNLISGNTGVGVEIRGRDSRENAIYNNLIGTDATGMTSLANAVGIKLVNTEGTAIGDYYGMTGANVISGNTQAGIEIQGDTERNNAILGNYIGTNALGNAAVPNTVGVLIRAHIQWILRCRNFGKHRCRSGYRGLGKLRHSELHRYGRHRYVCSAEWYRRSRQWLYKRDWRFLSRSAKRDLRELAGRNQHCGRSGSFCRRQLHRCGRNRNDCGSEPAGWCCHKWRNGYPYRPLWSIRA